MENLNMIELKIIDEKKLKISTLAPPQLLYIIKTSDFIVYSKNKSAF